MRATPANAPRPGEPSLGRRRRAVRILCRVTLYEIHPSAEPGDGFTAPIVIAAFDTWVDAGLAATTAAEHLAGSGPVLVTFDPAALFEHRARRPTLEMVDGPLARLTWPSLTIRRARLGYVSGAYPAAAAELLRAVGRHLGAPPPLGDLDEQARQLRTLLDTAAAVDEATRSYVERLEAMADEARLPLGEDLISEIERFLRERGNGGASSAPSR